MLTGIYGITDEQAKGDVESFLSALNDRNLLGGETKPGTTEKVR